MKTIVLIAPNVSDTMGGEAIKAFQYAKFLISQGRRVMIIAHSRCRESVESSFAPENYSIIEDEWRQALAWRSVVARPYVGYHFHRAVSERIAELFKPDEVILHYIAPVSPVVRRHPPPGYDFVVGPMTGNIYYPPGFRDRMTKNERIRALGHEAAQRLTGLVSREKGKAAALLVSGYERTRESLLMAGARDSQITDVIDSGVSGLLMDAPRLTQTGENHRFVTLGRLIPYKGYDLAIRGVAAATPKTELDIFGEGYLEPELRALAQDLGVADRVHFRGRLDNSSIGSEYANYRAFVFPTLAEANGIVMQEAMMIGLPVLTFRWGGPAMLADDDSAEFIEPKSEAQVVRELAQGMDRLATDPARAESLSIAGRAIAEAKFDWNKVAASWMATYPE
ncbi:MAG: glycosyltransferase family 4 protein [Polyangiales bacterium]